MYAAIYKPIETGKSVTTQLFSYCSGDKGSSSNITGVVLRTNDTFYEIRIKNGV